MRFGPLAVDDLAGLPIAEVVEVQGAKRLVDALGDVDVAVPRAHDLFVGDSDVLPIHSRFEPFSVLLLARARRVVLFALVWLPGNRAQRGSRWPINGPARALQEPAFCSLPGEKGRCFF